MSPVYRFSNAGGLTSEQRYTLMSTGLGDFGALQRIAFYNNNGSAFTNFTFTNIPQTFQDLVAVVYSRDTVSATTGAIFGAFNGDASATSYSNTWLTGNGASASSSRQTNQPTARFGLQAGATATSGIFATTTIHILNYANTSTFKAVLARYAVDLNGSGETGLTVNTWRNTAGINAFVIGSSVGFAAGTSFALYGVRASAS